MESESSTLTLKRPRQISGAANLCQSNHTTFNVFPDIAVIKILTQIVLQKHKVNQQEILLPYRLVCPQWNKIIINSSDLMRNIVFPVWHPKPFLDLPIVKQGKVRSIIFNNSFPATDATKLIEVIRFNVEKVQFAFNDKSSKNQQRQLFVLILQECKNLQELIIDGGIFQCPDFLSQSTQKVGFSVGLEFMGMGKRVTELSPVDSITNLSVNLEKFGTEEVNGLVQLILLLPKLERIDLYGCNQDAESSSTLLAGLCKYIEKYKSNILLKVLRIYPDDCSVMDLKYFQQFISLLILCKNHQIYLTEIPCMNINKLLALKKSQILISIPYHPLFNAKINGKLTFGDKPLKNLVRLRGLNIQRWDLIFERSIVKKDVSWMLVKVNKNFKSLALSFDPEKEQEQPSIAELEFILDKGFPNVKWFKVGYGILDPILAYRWTTYFPNLETLTIYSYKTMPADFISQLTSMECLSKLILSHLPCLDDNMFTTKQPNRFAKNGAPEFSPAIACFKALKILAIRCSNKLTEACLINGIAKCTTLEELDIFKCGSIKEEIGNLVSCKNVFIRSGEACQGGDCTEGDDDNLFLTLKYV